MIAVSRAQCRPRGRGWRGGLCALRLVCWEWP